MRIRSKAVTVLAAAGLLLGVGLASAGNAGAASPWTPFGAGTGIQQVTYNGFDSYLNKTGSGIVEQWIAPGAVGGTHGAYYLFKPLSGQAGSTTVSTPFKQSCDSQGLVGTAFPNVWTYSSGSYTPAGAIAKYFPYDGLSYWVCQYDLSNWASGDYHYTIYSAADRHVTFDVQMAAPGVPAHGWLNYSDADGISYSVVVTDVYISGNTATFSGVYPGIPNSWLVVQVSNNGGVLSSGGSVVFSDPTGSLSTFVPADMGVGVTGSITIYTR